MVDVYECRFNVVRKAWDLSFLAEAAELADLRRVLRKHLELWGLPGLVHEAQICVTELVANVIAHVGSGTPTSLAVSMNGDRLRLEVHDPDVRNLPRVGVVDFETEDGRGMLLVGGIAENWGVNLRAHGKVTWCELATGLRSSSGHLDQPQVTRAEALLGLWSMDTTSEAMCRTRLGVEGGEKAAIDVISDLLHWLRAHGCDPDHALDRAQERFESGAGGALCGG
ncbi:MULTISPECIES: ATP-binding protein [Streptomyces]|uniref:ATP-binding protein n=1 Tax=Streptomyces TaxID=1883 RepID=UPI0006913A0D|nr:ATP-binding protein [Streptomyces sp. NRRL S-15]KPC85066.1 regulator [Streptomyces sp. NRRL S-4]